MKSRLILTVALAAVVLVSSAAAELDYYKHLRYPSKIVPGVGRDKFDQEGDPDAVGYKRRSVQWWPRKGQDIIDIPAGAPLRTWTRNKGQKDPEALAGIARNWTASDPETFKAHLVAFRSFGTSTIHPTLRRSYIPIAILRLENGEQRGVLDHGDISQMLSADDHKFIKKVWEEAFPKLYAKTSQDESLSMKGGAPGGVNPDIKLELWTKSWPKFNAIEWPKEGAKYPRYGRKGSDLVFEFEWSRDVARWFRLAYLLADPFGCRCLNNQPCSVSTSRSSNRTCGFPASGFRTRTHAFAHGKLCVSKDSSTNPNVL